MADSKRNKGIAEQVLEGEQNLVIYEVTGGVRGDDFYEFVDKKRVAEASRAFDKDVRCSFVGCEFPVQTGTAWCADHGHLSDE